MLQSSLQDELKEVMSIREEIEYKMMREAINQFLHLFSLVSEILQYHDKNDENKDSHRNLIESCEDFLENIMQSLSIIGVKIINDEGTPFDPKRHEIANGGQAIRTTVAKVVDVGFIYKEQILKKAVVELNTAPNDQYRPLKLS